jgi:dihydropteroate synthase
MTFLADARLYFRPTAFVDAPFGHDGQVARLAGGLVWFSAYEVIAVVDGGRVDSRLVPIDRIDALIDSLSVDQAAEARAIIARILAPRAPLHAGQGVIRLDQPHVMAILNMTPDSFSDGGRHADDPDATARAGLAMAAAGAAIIDVGGESTRPGAASVWETDEIARTEPVIRRLTEGGAIVSIDSRKAAVMLAALNAGAAIVNDVSALCFDDQAASLVADRACPVVLMHHQGNPETMQKQPFYKDVLIEVYDWLAARIAFAVAAGISRNRIIVDPGIGFGKSLRHNLRLLNGLSLFHGLGCPILLGASRKRIIGALSDEAPTDQRLGGSLALALQGVQMGVQILRVHDAAETVQAIRVWRGMRDEALTPFG